MRRVLAVLAVAGLMLGACGKDSPPKAFPGTALDKAREYVRRADALGLPGGDAKDAAKLYGTVGDGMCSDKDPKMRAITGFDAVKNPIRAWRLSNIIVDIYCPQLSRFPKPAPHG